MGVLNKKRCNIGISITICTGISDKTKYKRLYYKIEL